MKYKRRKAFCPIVMSLASFVLALCANLGSAKVASAYDSIAPWSYNNPTDYTVTFTSSTLGHQMDYLICEPANYDTVTTSYPVLYLLHVAGGDKNWYYSLGICDLARSMMQDGTIPEMLLVLPEGEYNDHQDQWWTDHDPVVSDGARWGAYVSEDLVADVDANFRTLPDRAHRAIAGTSMGGFGAYQNALSHPQTFSSVSSTSMGWLWDWFPDSVLNFFGGRDRNSDWYRQHVPQKMIPDLSPDVLGTLRYRLDIGDLEGERIDRTLEVKSALEAKGIAVDYTLGSGDHDGTYFATQLVPTLKFIGDGFR